MTQYQALLPDATNLKVNVSYSSAISRNNAKKSGNNKMCTFYIFVEIYYLL